MKLDISYLLLLAALCPAANSYSLYVNGKTLEQNRSPDDPEKCANYTIKKGQNVSFYKDFKVSCDFRLFSKSGCKGKVVAKGSDDWKFKLKSQDTASYSILCGADRFPD